VFGSGHCHGIATAGSAGRLIEKSNGTVDRSGTQMHVPLRGNQILMSC